MSRLRSRDQALADRLQAQLDDLRDEVVYLRVKMRKEGSVSRRDYNDVRTQVESVRSEARGNASRRQRPPSEPSARAVRPGRPAGPAAAPAGTGTSGSGGVYGGTADARNPSQQRAGPPQRSSRPGPRSTSASSAS